MSESSPSSAPDVGASDTVLRLLAAEDARPVDGPELTLLLESANARDPGLRRTALRALGRLESADHIEAISAGLGDEDPSVRAVAAWALAQAVHTAEVGEAAPPDPATPTVRALDALVARAERESDPAARAALARSLGRLRLSEEGRSRALEALLGLSRPLGAQQGDADTRTLVGVALGLESLLRASRGEGVSIEVARRLEELAAHRRDAARDVDAARVRALAVSALGASRRLSLESILAATGDPSDEVRRVAIRYVGVVVPSRRAELVGRALEDPSVRVAIEATRAVPPGARTPEICRALSRAAEPDAHPALRVAALLALAAPCPGDEQGEVLRSAATELSETGGAWQAATAALGSLTRIDPDAARRLLSRYVYHGSPFVRAHAARAGGALAEADALWALARDASPIVRTAALDALFALEGHRIDALLREQLTAEDPELLLTAARLLEGSTDPNATAVAALDAFERISAARRETLRDPRRMLLERVDESGNGALAPRLRDYLADYDPVVARDVGSILDGWFGRPHEVAPTPLPRSPLPTPTEVEELGRTRVVLHVRDVGPIEIAPLPGEALTNAWRFVRLARGGYYDGLTFHRWSPNFVIQGGSPGANEYAGDGPFSRDEVGHPHWRGTVGLSTRGRDTGDAQFFINLSDNVALDPDYTVFGLVTDGLERVDRVLEGAVIDSVEVLGGLGGA